MTLPPLPPLRTADFNKLPTESFPPLPPLTSIVAPRGIVEVPLPPILNASPLYSTCPPAKILVADPPWKFSDATPHKGAADHYKVLTLDEIKAFPLPPLLPNAVLFLWNVEGLAEAKYEVARAWGFTPKSKITWRKVRACKSCKGEGFKLREVSGAAIAEWCIDCKGSGRTVLAGMGRYTRRATEDCLIAVRNGAKPSDCHPTAHDVADIFDAPRTEHSSKPDRFYELVEKLYPQGPYVELFARRRREGWHCYGDEL